MAVGVIVTVQHVAVPVEPRGGDEDGVAVELLDSVHWVGTKNWFVTVRQALSTDLLQMMLPEATTRQGTSESISWFGMVEWEVGLMFNVMP